MSASTWAPLRIRVFRALWIAQLGSAVGTWMQTVGAQWLLVDEPGAATLVSLVQTAQMAPVLLLALPAGVLADVFDRRRMLIACQAGMFVVGVALTVLTARGQMSPALLLAFTFILGCGATLTIPAWQAITPELVPRSQLTSASALGGVNMNLARAIGPAIAGLLIAQFGVAATFGFNTLTFAAMAVTLAFWKRPPQDAEEVPERFGAALRAGGRYVRHSPVIRRILLRSVLFVVPGSVLWALLALIASQSLNLGASGYGVLLGALGLGAVAGAFALPTIRARLSMNGILVAASVVYGGALVVVAAVPNVVIATVALVLAGAAWLAVLASLNAIMQLFLPGWVRARGLSTYQIVFMGGQGLGAVGWGLTAERFGLVAAFVAAAVLMLAGALSTLRWPLLDTDDMDRAPASYWPEPHLAYEPALDEGPVLVTVAYRVADEQAPTFIDAMQAVRRSRQRTGATRWRLYQDGGDANRFVEAYLVPSWAEHVRQHHGRLTGADQVAERRAVALADGPPTVEHLLPARANRHAAGHGS